MTKREKKKHSKRLTLRELEHFSTEIMARYGYLSVKELEFDARLRRKAIRMARKRAKRLRYIQ